MSHSNLTRVLLLSTLVWTLSTNCILKVSAQARKDLSASIVKQEQATTSYQELLRKTDILQQKAEKFRKTVDIFNLQLQEQFKSKRITNTVDFQQVLVNWEQFNRIWHDFTRDLEQNPELANLLQEDKVFSNIDQNLLFQKEIISSLARVLNESSTLIITEFQEQLFTKRELNRNYYPYGTFETKTQHKFALTSTNKARELELQVSQIENILSNYLLYKEQGNHTSYKNIGTTTTNSTDTRELVDDSPGQTEVFYFNILIVLILLSSCATFIFFRANKRKKKQNQNQSQKRDSEAFQNKVENYLHKVDQVENQARDILNSSNQIIENEKQSIEKQKQSQKKNSFTSAAKESQAKPNLPRESVRKKSLTENSKQVLQESLEKFTSLITEEDLIIAYRQNPQLLSEKAIKVQITRESIQRSKAGEETEIIFKRATNDSYWILMEPVLGNNCYFLVPNPNLEVNSLIFPSIENIFNCKGYHNRSSSRFNLKLSAMVQIHSTSSWKLIGTGELVFN